jgi:hypothetical protein
VNSLIVLPIVLAGIAGPTGAPVEFVRDVRPIFQRHCYGCHGPAKQRAGFRLDIKSEAFKGGDKYGPAILRGKASTSPLIQLVSGRDKSLVMPPKGERLSAAQIALLEAWINEGALWPDGIDTSRISSRHDHWSLQPLTSPAPLLVKGEAWGRNPIDEFILAGLEKAELKPAAEADRTAWLRRVSFDLTGLPPTPAEVGAFAADCRPEAFECVVDRLLNSPRYGERWAQHWLDVVRYADTHGFEVNTERPNAWPYRDYVIAAFNQDRGYDRFVREQVAGDASGEDAATGFLVTSSVLLPGQIGADEPSKRLARQDALDEIVINVGQTFLGMSIGCARCHDHKFDPIAQREYYSMQAFFAGVEYGDREWKNNKSGLSASASKKPMAFAGVFRKPDVIHVLNRGDPEQPKEEVAPAVPAALGDLRLATATPEQQRRLALAEWLVSPRNPLTARVIVNRIWQGHFGTGLVETPSDFGRNGSKPSHPELLDWLAQELIRSGWSLKHLHKLIVLSATYRQSSARTEKRLAKDADDRMLWCFPSRRLEAEAIRDAILAVSGRLNGQMGGRGFNMFDQRGGLSGFKPVESFKEDGRKRMIYAHRVRRERDAVFGALDCPDFGQSTARRRESTTPIQALNLFNSRFTMDEAAAFAARVNEEVGLDPCTQIRRAYSLALNRAPELTEIRAAEPVVRSYGLAALCRALFNCNEFLFLP